MYARTPHGRRPTRVHEDFPRVSLFNNGTNITGIRLYIKLLFRLEINAARRRNTKIRLKRRIRGKKREANSSLSKLIKRRPIINDVCCAYCNPRCTRSFILSRTHAPAADLDRHTPHLLTNQRIDVRSLIICPYFLF